MMIGKKWVGVLVAGLVSMSGAASAATIDFTSYNAPQNGPLTFGNGNETVLASASRIGSTGAPVSGTALIASYGSAFGGLGVCTSAFDPTDTGACDTKDSRYDTLADSHLVDGDERSGFAAEAVLLNFGALVVDLVSITFNYVNDGDDFNLMSNLSPSWVERTISKGDFQQTFTFASTLRGSVFGIAADGKKDDFKIKSIDYTVVTPTSPVPLPAAGLLLMGALAGAAALRRRKTA